MILIDNWTPNTADVQFVINYLADKPVIHIMAGSWGSIRIDQLRKKVRLLMSNDFETGAHRTIKILKEYLGYEIEKATLVYMDAKMNGTGMTKFFYEEN